MAPARNPPAKKNRSAKKPVNVWIDEIAKQGWLAEIRRLAQPPPVGIGVKMSMTGVIEYYGKRFRNGAPQQRPGPNLARPAAVHAAAS